MLFLKIIFISSIVAWLFPIFRQYKHKYFYFFLILAFGDPFNLLIVELLHISLERSSLLSALLMVLSFIGPFKKRFWLYTSILLLLGCVIIKLVPISDYVLEFLIMVLLLILVFFTLKALIFNSLNTKSINLFYFVLFLYALSLALKYYIVLTLVTDYFIYFQLTNIFEILIAVFFSFYNEENSIKIKFEG